MSADAGRPVRDGGDRGDHGRVRTQRLFVAVPLPDAVRGAVTGLVDEVRGAVGDVDRPVRWVRLDGLHLTLRFLGPTTPDRLAAVEAAVRVTAAQVAPVPVALGGAGAFPSAGRPRVLWLGVAGGAAALAEMAAGLETRLEQAGWPAEGRPFQAHLTLARCDGVRSGPRTAAELIRRAESFEAAWTADRIVLFESHVGGGPARYEALVEVPLTG